MTLLITFIGGALLGSGIIANYALGRIIFGFALITWAMLDATMTTI